MRTLHAHEQTVGKYRRQTGIEDLLAGTGDIIVESVIGEHTGVAVVDATTGARVAIARLTDAANGDDVLGRRIADDARRQDRRDAIVVKAERYRQVRVTDERHRGKLILGVEQIDDLVGGEE